MKELTKAYSTLLQDKRVKSEQARYENFTRQRNMALSKYRKIFQNFNDLTSGVMKAQNFYSEVKGTVNSLEKNAEAFVNNRRSEGAQLLNQIERDKRGNADSQADRERDRLRDLMERMSTGPSVASSVPEPGATRASPASRSSQIREAQYRSDYPWQPASTSPPSQNVPSASPPYQSPQHYANLPDGYIPPPPPPGPPPPSSYGNYTFSGYSHASGASQDGNRHVARRGTDTQPQGQADPWASLNAWK